MPDIRLLVTIERDPHDIFPLVAGSTGLTNWWTDDVVVRPDGSLQTGVDGATRVCLLRPETMIMPARAAWAIESTQEWGGTSLVFDLSTAPSGSRLLFTHGGWKRESDVFLEFSTMWGALLYRLKDTAESGDEHPLFTRPSPARG